MKYRVFAVALGMLFLLAGGTVCAGEKWQGVDESVIERIAGEQGRHSRDPLIPIEGDVQLLAFLMAGTVGGFAAGYYWRVLMEGKKQPPK